MQVITCPSVVFVELVRLAHLVPADSGNESPDRCEKEVFITGALQSTECADEDQHEGNDKGLRAHGLGRLGVQGRHELGEMLLGERRKNTIRDAVGQSVGPLGHGRGGNADCFGCGCDRASEQFNGF